MKISELQSLSLMMGLLSVVLQAYKVQCLPVFIDSVQGALPTLLLFIESRESLRELQFRTFKICMLGPVTNTQKEDILKTIDFVMNESKSHNLEVIGMVGMDLWVDETAKTLLCNVHFLMMFQKSAMRFKIYWGPKKLLNVF